MDTSNSNGAGVFLYAGETSRGLGARRALLKFDVAASVPAGAHIDSVTLKLHVAKDRGISSDFGVYPMQASWGEGSSDATLAVKPGDGTFATTNDATWNDRFFNSVPAQAVPWTNPGGDFAPGSSSVVTVGSSGAFYTWPSTAQLVADVQSMLNTPAASYGWILIGNETTAGNAKRLASRENPTVSYRPTLTITYTAVPAPGGAALLALACAAAARRRR